MAKALITHIPMLGSGISSVTTGVRLFTRSMTPYDTNDYDGVSRVWLEFRACNRNASSRDVRIKDSAGNVKASKTVAGGMGTTVYTRFEVDFTPNDGADFYYLELDASTTQNYFRITSADICTLQLDPTKTVDYIHLGGEGADVYDYDDNILYDVIIEAYDDTTGWTRLSEYHYFDWMKDLSNYGDSIAVKFESVFALSGDTDATAYVALWNLTTDNEIAASELSHTGDNNFYFGSADISLDEAHFTDADKLGVKGKAFKNDSSYAGCHVHKAWIKIIVTNLTKCEAHIPVGRYQGAMISPTAFLTWNRTLLNLLDLSTPQYYFEASVYPRVFSGTTYVCLFDVGTSDSGARTETGTEITGSRILDTDCPLQLENNTIRVGPLTLTDENRVAACVGSSGTYFLYLSYAYLVITLSGFGGVEDFDPLFFGFSDF